VLTHPKEAQRESQSSLRGLRGSLSITQDRRFFIVRTDTNYQTVKKYNKTSAYNVCLGKKEIGEGNVNFNSQGQRGGSNDGKEEARRNFEDA